ncbi:MAG: hypothetical protein E4H15_06250 [Syntrophobacterales bacterium]|nr:MAG: hypothetical protein E4H15_06250 [Syntrophobacterales bacterium]
MDPKKGNIDEEFTFTAEYTHDEPPQVIKVEIDGVNHTMVEKDIADIIYQDGKEYIHTTYLPIGGHSFRVFGEVTGENLLVSQKIFSPWVNVSLGGPQAFPTSGYVTTPFKFAVNYGSTNNLAPDQLYMMANGVKYDLTRTSPTPNYIKGDVRFETTIYGMDLMPSPVIYSYHVVTGPDTYSIGPFNIEGPSDEEVVLSGVVRDPTGAPLGGVTVDLEPGPETISDGSGHYHLTTFKATKYQGSYRKEGFLDRSYEVDILNNRNLDMVIEPLPRGGIVTGSVRFFQDDMMDPVIDAEVNLTGQFFSAMTMTDVNGRLEFLDVPAGAGYSLSVKGSRYIPQVIEISVVDGVKNWNNITLIERDMGVAISPDPAVEPVSVDGRFQIFFPLPPRVSTVSVFLINSSSEVMMNIENSSTMNEVDIRSSHPLLFNSGYDLVVKEGVMDISGELMVWRDIHFPLETEEQTSLEVPVTDPSPDQMGVPLNRTITISWGIGLDQSTFSFSLIDLDSQTDDISTTVSFSDSVDWEDSGRTDTIISIDPGNFSYGTRYGLEVSSGLEDILGNRVMSQPFSMEFSTVNEPDSDGDGHYDSTDRFPDDPDEWADRDNDGYGDNRADQFPDDPTEWLDTDGDGVGDNTDIDDDGDGMPDQWEIDNGLDPLDPSDAFLDNDGDGYDNVEEYRGGTDPNDKGDKPGKGSQIGFETWMLISAIVIALIMVGLAVLVFSGTIIKRDRALEKVPSSDRSEE